MFDFLGDIIWQIIFAFLEGAPIGTRITSPLRTSLRGREL